ncbi:MAG TPA: ClpX C4-type zinc finger protein [Xanthobacteraceae bacterium]|jgi:hypothetical protein
MRQVRSATPIEAEAPPMRCSFCGKGEDEITQMICGRDNTTRICDECVDAAAEEVARTRCPN